MKQAVSRPFVRRHPAILALLALVIMGASSCGVFVDMAKDNEWRMGFIGNVSFVSPYKIKIGVAPFHDEVGLGTPEAGPAIARLLEAELQDDKRLIVVPMSEVASAISARGLSYPLSPEEAAEVARALNLQALVVGSISQISQYSMRKGWRRIARFFTSQREYVDAMLSVTTVDAATGIVLSSRATQGEYVGSSSESELFPTDAKPAGPTQEAMENSLDGALHDAYYRVVEGLGPLPFKAAASSSSAGTASIPFGSDSGIDEGDRFVVLSIDETVTNAIGVSYDTYGPPKARLRAASVAPDRTELAIEEGGVSPGEIVQAMD